MPEALRERLRALEQTVALSVVPPAGPPDAGVVSKLAGATDRSRRVRLRYRSVRREDTSRVVDPYALLQREGRWYLFGHEIAPGRDGRWELELELGGPPNIRHEIQVGRVDEPTHAAFVRQVAERPGEPLAELPDGFEPQATVTVVRR